MHRLAPWIALIWVGTGVASAQSLAEVAKKEKDRRARASGSQGDDAVIPVIRDDELAEARGDGVSIMGSSAESIDDDASDGTEKNELDDPDHGLTEAQIRDYRDRWARIWPERVAAAEKELELANDDVFQCQSAAHYVFVPLAIDCNGVFERRAIAEYQLDEIRRNRFNWELLLPERPRPPPSN